MASDSDLIIVPGHAVFMDPVGIHYVGGYPGEGPLYREHARRGVQIAAGSAGILMFSGGATQALGGWRTEAESYLEVAAARGWWGRPDVSRRAFTEDYARDSFENLLFSLAWFRELRGRLPRQVAVVGWRFKAARFELHRAAIGWPAGRFRYIGVNNPPPGAVDQARRCEAALLAAVGQDPLLEGPEFAAKRRKRDPFERGAPYRYLPLRVADSG